MLVLALLAPAGSMRLPRIPPRHGAPGPTMSAADTAALRSGWDRGEGASSLRPLVEAAAASVDARAAAAATAGSVAQWAGLWVARIEHFEKVQFTGLRVRPHYALDADGGIVSDVHIALGPLRGWASAAGRMDPATDGGATTRLHFDDFWIGADASRPRAAPPEQGASALDGCVRALGRAAFFEGLAGFPVDYADLPAGFVAFRFPPLDSCIVARRAPEGEAPSPC